jgi:hypothetical protein
MNITLSIDEKLAEQARKIAQSMGTRSFVTPVHLIVRLLQPGDRWLSQVPESPL